MNCWEFMNCGREPGGSLAEKDGICPAAIYEPADGFLDGTNGGCACAFVTGTFCEEVLQGTYRDKSKECWDCEFFRMLRRKHGAAFSMPAFALHVAKLDQAAFDAFVAQNRDAEDRG